MQINYGENEIKSLLSKLKIFNKEIGNYQIFAITENFDYAIKLSNGKLLIKVEDLQDDQNDALTPERLQAIASRFASSNTKTQPLSQTQSKAVPSVTTQTKPSKTKSSVGKIILFISLGIVIVLSAFVILTNTNTGSGSTYPASETYHEKVMTVEEIEHANPTDFLTADGTYKETFWGDKIKVNCVITNKATVATYKDPVVRITYYSKSKTNLGTKDYTIYEVFPPHSEKTVALKIENYKDVNSIGWSVVNAIAN